MERKRKLKVGLHIGKFDWPGSPSNISEKLGAIAKTVEENRFYSLWVMDHLFQLGTQYGIIHGPVEAPMLEGYSTIAYLAALTQKIKIGLAVTCNFFRHPGLLVKIVSTIDVLSKGRTYLGIGAGWFEHEAKGLGIPLPPSFTERFKRLEETLQIVKHMWNGNTDPYEGNYYRLSEPINSPQPLSTPHPPIMIGGAGEKKTLRLVARYADACNIVLGSPNEEFGELNISHEEEIDYLLRKINVLKKHCKDIGRPYNEIEKTVATYIKLTSDSRSTDEIITFCGKLADLGIQHVIFNIPNVHEITPLNILGKVVIPTLEKLT
jgi:alkanesulfonate monooxygenase